MDIEGVSRDVLSLEKSVKDLEILMSPELEQMHLYLGGTCRSIVSCHDTDITTSLTHRRTLIHKQTDKYTYIHIYIYTYTYIT